MKASKEPKALIAHVTPTGAPATLSQYLTGYESYMDKMPAQSDVEGMVKILDDLGNNIMTFEQPWIAEGLKVAQSIPKEDIGLLRTIIAIDENLEGQIVFGMWRVGERTSVHGHNAGLNYESLLIGKLRVYSYEIIDSEKRTVRLKSTRIVEPGYQIINYAEGGDYENNIHSIEVLEPSASLHFFGKYAPTNIGNNWKVVEEPEEVMETNY